MAGSKTIITYLQGVFFPVYIGVAFSEKQYLKEMKRLGVKEPIDFHSSTASMKSLVNGDKETLIVCFDPTKHRQLHRNQVAAILAHECVHVSDAIFRRIGEHAPGDETRAYLVQYILQETLYLLDDHLKHRRRHGKKR